MTNVVDLFVAEPDPLRVVLWCESPRAVGRTIGRLKGT